MGYLDNITKYVGKKILCKKTYVDAIYDTPFVEGEFYELDYMDTLQDYLFLYINRSTGSRTTSFEYSSFIEHFELITQTELRQRKIESLLK